MLNISIPSSSTSDISKRNISKRNIYSWVGQVLLFWFMVCLGYMVHPEKRSSFVNGLLNTQMYNSPRISIALIFIKTWVSVTQLQYSHAYQMKFLTNLLLLCDIKKIKQISILQTHPLILPPFLVVRSQSTKALLDPKQKTKELSGYNKRVRLVF